jgi:hypothetical protein
LALAAVVVALIYPAVCFGARELPPISYTGLDGHTETLTPWQGQSVSVLVESPERDPVVMSNLVGALDAAWNYYAATTGRSPSSLRSLNGRDEIAEVSSIPAGCAACSYLGATGTDILNTYFEPMYQQIAKSNLYDQIPFYELGRTFWFWSPQLQFHSPDQDPVVTGYAVLMRFESMAAAGVSGAPFNGTPFVTFQSQVAALAGQYEANPSLTFAQTLALDKSPGAYGGTDFWASLMMQLAARHGGQKFLNRFFSDVARLPAASSTAGAVTNWVKAASYAACTDLSSVFYVRWGFPRPDGSVTARPAASAVPEPTSGACGDVTVTLNNVDDYETVLLNGKVAGSAGYGQTREIDLGTLARSDRITLQDRNGAGGYAWGFVVRRDGQTVYTDSAGRAGAIGADHNDLTHPNQIVRSVTITPNGHVLASYEVDAP